MEDIKKTNENVEEKEDRYGWIDGGIEELKEGDLDIVFRPIVKVPQERYEELIKAEATLEILGRVIAEKKPYELSTFKAVAGKYIPDDKDGDDE